MLGQRLNILEIATTLLNGVVAHFAASTDPDMVALPVRRMLLAGDAAAAAWDCEQLTVSLQGVGFGQSDDASPQAPQIGAGASVFSVRHAIFEVTLLRCVDVLDDNGNHPPDGTLYAEGAQMMRDAGMLSQALTEVASRVRAGLEPEGTVRAGQVLPVGPDGGFGGVTALFQVTSMRLV